MIKTVALVIALALSTSLCLAAQDLVHVVDGTVKKVDSGTKTVVVETKDGTEHTFHYLERRDYPWEPAIRRRGPWTPRTE